MNDIHRWWKFNREHQQCSVIFAYSLGKAQRILAGLQDDVGPIGVHGAVHALLPYYEEAGVRFPRYELIDTKDKEQLQRFIQGGMVIAPPSANGSPWLAKFDDCATASASGWMTVGFKPCANVGRASSSPTTPTGGIARNHPRHWCRAHRRHAWLRLYPRPLPPRARPGCLPD